jgi:hypothetical protein
MRLLSVHRKDGGQVNLGFRLQPFLQRSSLLVGSTVAICVHAVLLDPPAQQTAAPSLESLLSSLQITAASPAIAHGLSTPNSADPHAAARTLLPPAAPRAGVAVLAVRSPTPQPHDLAVLLAELQRAGLVLHWEWAPPPPPSSPCAPPCALPHAGAAAAAAAATGLVLADVAALRGRAAAAAALAAAGCRTGLLCRTLLALAAAPAAAPAAPAAPPPCRPGEAGLRLPVLAGEAGCAGGCGRGAGCECCAVAELATDLGFLVYTEP